MLWRNPHLLWLLAAVAGTGVLLLFSGRRRRAALNSFAEAGLVDRLVPDLDTRRRKWRAALRVLGLTFLAVALAGPRWGFHWEEVHREGIDLIVALDTSRSMLAADVKPNRLERAKLAILDLVKLLHGDRIGLVAFAGTAFLECPLTLDYSAFERSLDAMQVGIIPRGGTAMERAINTSLEGFEARQGKHEALILITDGENHEGDPEAAAKRAQAQGVKIYTVGIGTAEGELIPASGKGRQGFVKDRKGQVVKSRLDEDTLQKIALASDGAYVRGIGAVLGLDEVFRDHIAKMERRELASSLERRYEDRFQLPLAIALALLLLEWLTGDRKRGGARRRTAMKRWWRRLSGRAPRPSASGGMAGGHVAVLLLCLLPALVGWFDPPGDRAAAGNRLYDAGKYAGAAEKYRQGLVDAPESPLLQFNLGTALYRAGKYADAARSFTKVASSGDPKWVARAAYNLGNSLYRLGENGEAEDPQAALGSYEQALAAYRRAMAADNQDRDPKFDYELTVKHLQDLKKKLEEQQKQQQQQQQDQEQNQQQQDKQQQEIGEKQEGTQPQDQEQDEQKGQQQEGQPQQAAGGDKQEDQEQQQPAGGAEQQDQEQEKGAQNGEAGAATAGQGEESDGEEEMRQQAARAVLDTARGEELDPDEVQRGVGVAGMGEPREDW